MPLGLVRAGLFGWGHRRGLGRLLVCWGVAAMALPVVLGLLVVAALAGGSSAVVPAAGAPAAPLAAWVVTQPYGCTGLAFEPPRGSCAHFHYGIDLAAPAGAPVSAVAAGQAELFLPAGLGGGYGLHVVVHHGGGVETLYGHLQDVAIASGDSVGAGTVLGHEGSTGMSTGPHLHFEVREAGIAVDPTRVFPGIFGPDGQKR
jgi:murein DD-endopeptidase MepM/ murein hydrolase activator NlpD